MTLYSPRKHGPLPSGTRVHTWAQQFPRAYQEGTATILRMTREQLGTA